jgi:hypothetical protein
VTGLDYVDVLRPLVPLAVLVLALLGFPWLERIGSRWRAAIAGRFAPPPDAASAFTIASAARAYDVMLELGTGDACDVWLATSGRDKFVLKTARTPEIGELLANEFELLRQLQDSRYAASYRRYMPQPVESFLWRGSRVNAFAYRDGLYSAEEIRLSHPHGVDGRHLAWMFNRTLEVLGHVHRLGWVHGAVLPPHLLFDVANHGLVLVDWIHARPLGQPLIIVPERFKPWYPPECHRREPASEATDLCLAARSLIYLAGGDPLAGVLPPHVPTAMAEFFGRCLHDLPHGRPQDAWRLRDEFVELLARLFGPPQFHVLAMH